jgi:hypothetical protein
VLSLRVTILFYVIAPIHLSNVYNLITTTTEGPVLSAIFYDPKNLEENKNYKALEHPSSFRKCVNHVTRIVLLHSGVKWTLFT